VRSAREIEATLDDRGCLEELPFMPEMTAFCGTVQRVFRRVDKIIDIIEFSGLRRMSGTVTLEEVRCDGRAHGQCQQGCHVLWKDAWLRPAGVAGGREIVPGQRSLETGQPSPSESDGNGPEGGVYRCQATELFRASAPLSKWDPRQYLAPLWYGNVTPLEFLRGVTVELFNAVQRLRGGATYPHWPGSRLEKTPTLSLGLQEGEWVRVRSKDEILQTLDRSNRNRGLWFDREMVQFCGRKFRVAKRVERLIEEKTGRLVQLKSPCVILNGVTARGEFYRFNPQNDYILWREIWLERLK
jgi:hypothetical protein